MMHPHEHYEDEREGINRRPRRPLEPQQIDLLDAAMTHCQLQRTMRYHPADLLAAVVRLWADVENWRDNYRAVHEELEKADDTIAQLHDLVEQLTLPTSVEVPKGGSPRVKVTRPMDGIEIWWGVDRGVEVRTTLSRILLVCETHAAAAQCRELMREASLSWAPGQATTPEHEAVLRTILRRVEGVTPGLDLARWLDGVKA
tara:strand:+ start:1965 stop:2567 length:603 start_codon:yes stop_codon:yes gene_type:complete